MTHLFLEIILNENKSREEKLRDATHELMNDINLLTAGLFSDIRKKAEKEAEFEISKKFQQSFIEAVQQVKTKLDDFFDDKISKNQQYDIKSFKGFGTKLTNELYKLCLENFDKLTSKPNENINVETIEQSSK